MSNRDEQKRFMQYVADKLDEDDFTIDEKAEFLKNGFDRIPKIMMERHGLDDETAYRMVAECMMIRGFYIARQCRGEISRNEGVRMREMVDNLIIAEYSLVQTVH